MTTGFGVFGKIPSMGDFMRLNLSPGFVQIWDDWLQRGLVSLQESLGAAWDGCYMSAPIWRFSLPAGQAGPTAVCGILMASVDRVGRRYPLTFAAPLPDASAAAVHFGNEPVFAQLEHLALAALEDRFDRDSLMPILSALHVAIPTPRAQQGMAFIGNQPPEVSLSANVIDESYGKVGLWSSVVDQEHRMLLCRDLPSPGELHALFDFNAPLWRKDALAQHA